MSGLYESLLGLIFIESGSLSGQLSFRLVELGLYKSLFRANYLLGPTRSFSPSRSILVTLIRRLLFWVKKYWGVLDFSKFFPSPTFLFFSLVVLLSRNVLSQRPLFSPAALLPRLKIFLTYPSLGNNLIILHKKILFYRIHPGTKNSTLIRTVSNAHVSSYYVKPIVLV